MTLGNPMAEGNTANIFLLDNKIIKVFKDHLPKTEAMYEANKQKLAFLRGISVPKVLDVTEMDGKQAIIMEYIQGETLGKLLLNNMEKSLYYMDVSVDIQMDIHKTVIDSLEPMSQKLKRQINSAPNLSEKLKSKILDKLDLM